MCLSLYGAAKVDARNRWDVRQLRVRVRGTDDPRVSRHRWILRHSKFTMPFDVYSEASDEEIRDALQRLSSGLGQGGHSALATP